MCPPLCYHFLCYHTDIPLFFFPLFEDYGEAIISYLSKVLSVKYGKGYSKTNLYNYVSFYQTYPNFFQLPTGEFDIDKIF